MIDLGQKLVIVGGKGGVGRSSTAACLAVFLARRGKRVLAVDAVGSGGLLSAFAHRNMSVSPGEISPLVAHGVEVSILEISTESSLQEYIQRVAPLPAGSSRLIAMAPVARMFDYVSNAAPAVKEILTIGKIGHEVRYGDWDVVVVDAPATGHLIELLSAPESLSELVRVGPLVEQTAWLGQILADPSQSVVLLVTTPEELPVSELLELDARIKNETACNVGGIIVNRMTPVLSEDGISEAVSLIKSASSLAPAAQIVLHRSAATTQQIKRVNDLELPRIDVEEGPDPLESIVEAMSQSIPGEDR